MHLVFWQPIPSFHQEGFLNLLARADWVQSVTLKVEQDLLADFQKSGWPAPRFEGVCCERIKPNEQPQDSAQHLHIFTGFKTHGTLWEVFGRFSRQRKSRVFAYAEAPSQYGYAGYLRWLKYRWNGYSLSAQLDGVLALGQRGVDFYSSILRRRVPVYRFAYYDQPLSEFPELMHLEQNSKVQFLYVGRLISLKGLDRMLRAFAALRDQEYDWHLTLLGEGPVRRKLQLLAERLGIAAKVEWHATVPAGEVGAYYAVADYLIQPSRADGWGMTIPESLRHGCQPIASTACGAADLALDSFKLPTEAERMWPTILSDALRLGPLTDLQRCENRKRAEAYTAEAGVERLKSILTGSMSDD